MASANEYAVIGSGYTGTPGMSLERTLSDGNRALSYDFLVNDDETDIDFINKIYRGENPDFFLGGWIVKAVSDVLLQFMGMPTPEAKNDSTFNDLLSTTYDNNKSKLYNTLKYLGLYGQAYVEIGYNQQLKRVTYKPLTKREVVEVRKENWNDSDDITYIRIRTTVEKYNEEPNMEDENDIAEKEYIHFDKIYWKENNIDYLDALESGNADGKDEFVYYVKVLKIDGGNVTEFRKQMVNPWNCIPVVEFNQGRLNGDANGYSDANGVIKLAGVYHQILERAIDSNMYNGQPTIVFSGLDDPRSFVQEMYGDIDANGVVTEGIYETLGGYYLKGGASVSYLQVGDTVSNAKALLELLFYIFIQMSGVPEWALGASVNNTYASTKVQSNSLIQKIEGKRYDTHDSFIKLNAYTGLVHEANSDDEFDELNSSIKWNDVIPEEQMSLQERITLAKQSNLISDETYLQLLDVVEDYKSEIKVANKQNKAKMSDEAENIAIIKKVQQSVLNDDEVDVGEMDNKDFLSMSDEMVRQTLLLLGES